MSMSDCPKCWDTPCTCGHEYESWSESLIKWQITILEKVLAEKQIKSKIRPAPKCSEFGPDM